MKFYESKKELAEDILTGIEHRLMMVRENFDQNNKLNITGIVVLQSELEKLYDMAVDSELGE
jgi:hypothetical protein